MVRVLDLAGVGHGRVSPCVANPALPTCGSRVHVVMLIHPVDLLAAAVCLFYRCNKPDSSHLSKTSRIFIYSNFMVGNISVLWFQGIVRIK
jgi:hypothetical protein